MAREEEREWRERKGRESDREGGMRGEGWVRGEGGGL